MAARATGEVERAALDQRFEHAAIEELRADAQAKVGQVP